MLQPEATNLVRALTGKHGSRSPKKDLHIEPGRPSFRILQIQTHHVVKPEPASPVHLPEAGNSGLHFQYAPPMPDVVDRELIRDRRSGADQRHLPPPYIEKLWELVPNRFPQKPPDVCQARIFGDLVNNCAVWFCRALIYAPFDESF